MNRRRQVRRQAPAASTSAMPKVALACVLAAASWLATGPLAALPGGGGPATGTHDLATTIPRA